MTVGPGCPPPPLQEILYPRLGQMASGDEAKKTGGGIVLTDMTCVTHVCCTLFITQLSPLGGGPILACPYYNIGCTTVKVIVL